MSQFEAALNLLREERLAVTAARGQILRDVVLEADDRAHRDQLLAQTMAEMAQISRAITLLERVQSGELVEMDMPPPTRRGPVPDEGPPPRQTGLIRKFKPVQGTP